MSSLWSQFKTLILIGWVIALVRLGLDAAAPGASMYFGVYYGMPIVLLFFSIMGKYKGVPWKRLALGMILTGVLVWGLPNLIAYTTAQFAGWDHGRFGEGRGPGISESAMGKVTVGLMTAGMTSFAGSIWMILWSTILIWLPGKLGAGSAPEVAKEEVAE